MCPKYGLRESIPCQSCPANKQKLREYKKQDKLDFNISRDQTGALPSRLVMINGVGLFFSDYPPLDSPLTSVVTNHLPYDDVNRGFLDELFGKKDSLIRKDGCFYVSLSQL